MSSQNRFSLAICRIRRVRQSLARAAAFTLVELLVVIGIIALLISILLPALNRARQQAQLVQCASNMRQIYLASEMYVNLYKGFIMPSRVASGTAVTQSYWCGSDVLGTVLGNGGGTTQEMADRLAKILKCPSSDRPKDVVSGICIDYTYNSNLGDDRAYPWSAQYSAGFVNLTFKKRVNVPGNVIMAVDAANLIQPNDERFQLLADLTYKKRYAGWPHMKMANFLFADGVVRAVDPWAANVADPYTQALPMSATTSNPVLDDFMIDVRKWEKGRAIPF